MRLRAALGVIWGMDQRIKDVWKREPRGDGGQGGRRWARYGKQRALNPLFPLLFPRQLSHTLSPSSLGNYRGLGPNPKSIWSCTGPKGIRTVEKSSWRVVCLTVPAQTSSTSSWPSSSAPLAGSPLDTAMLAATEAGTVRR